MKFCLLRVENTRNICKNNVINPDFNKITGFFQLRKIILVSTEEALDKKLAKYKVSASLFDDQSEHFCEPPFLMAE